jgi:hypothetical protein
MALAPQNPWVRPKKKSILNILPWPLFGMLVAVDFILVFRAYFTPFQNVTNNSPNVIGEARACMQELLLKTMVTDALLKNGQAYPEIYLEGKTELGSKSVECSRAAGRIGNPAICEIRFMDFDGDQIGLIRKQSGLMEGNEYSTREGLYLEIGRPDFGNRVIRDLKTGEVTVHNNNLLSQHLSFDVDWHYDSLDPAVDINAISLGDARTLQRWTSLAKEISCPSPMAILPSLDSRITVRRDPG